MSRLALVSWLLASACTVHHHHHHAAPAPEPTPTAVAVAEPAPSLAPPSFAAPTAPTPTPPGPSLAAPPVAAPPPPPAAPAAATRSFLDIGRPGEPFTMADLDAANAELARRFAVPKQFLIANRATYAFYTAFLGRVGRPGELAPILEAPGGGHVLGLHRNVAELEQHPEVVRLDAAGAVLWRLALPRPRRFTTYEVMGLLPAPDGTLLVMTIPYSGRGGNPHPAMLAKVTLDGQLVWSMQLAEDRRRVDGPFPQDLTIDADGTIHLTGHATYQRDRRPGHDATLRAWTGRVSATGRQLSDTIRGDYTWTVEDAPSARRIFGFWHDLHRPSS